MGVVRKKIGGRYKKVGTGFEVSGVEYVIKLCDQVDVTVVFFRNKEESFAGANVVEEAVFVSLGVIGNAVFIIVA